MNAALVAARALAIAIAIAGIIDPAITSMRNGEPEVAVVTTSPADSALARRVAETLGKDYTVVRGEWDRVAATIIVGSSVPTRIPAGRIFAVRDTGRPSITRFDVPATTTTEARQSIPVSANGPVELYQLTPADTAGIAPVLLDRDSTAAGIAIGGERTRHLTLTAPAAGPMLLEARVRHGRDSATALALTNVVDRPHAVLFFDRRPSWVSTFVRRALERDRRFAVASRVVTSRGISTDAGQPPSSLADPTVLELYDVVVVGAPQTLTAADVAGLETFLRKRGGAVVLLLDEPPGPSTPAIDRLTGVARWNPLTLRTPAPARTNTDTAALRFSEGTWPQGLPTAAESRAVARTGSVDRPIVWANAVGGGEVIVSGALDAWKFRDPRTSSFDEFWRATISRAAREAQDAVRIAIAPNVAAPDEKITVTVTTRDSLARPELRVDSTVVQLWQQRPGIWSARIPSPSAGIHWATAAAGGVKAEAPFAVHAGVDRAHRDEWATLSMLANASGGTAGPLNDVARDITARVVAEKRLERWWPMHTGWWILPFVALLGFEWMVRRRRGLA